MNMIRIKTSKVFNRMDALMLTTDDLAEAIGVTTKTMSRILTQGTCFPTTMGKLAMVLGIKTWELVA